MADDRVIQHYGTEPLWDRVNAALSHVGLGGEHVDWPAFAPLDEFHTRGLVATRELAEALAPSAGECVLDVGCGLGGPARLLAGEHGCDVTGIDLSSEFVDVATRLTERAGLSALARFQQGDALELPFTAGAFDHVVTQHAAMNIADRSRLYTEIRRVIRPGGRFAVYDIVAGDGEPPRFPLPWAREPDTSFLLTAAQTRAAVAAAGFHELSFHDQTRVSAEWFKALLASAGPGGRAPAIGLPVVMGDEFPLMAANLAANLAQGRVGVIQLVARAGPRARHLPAHLHSVTNPDRPV
jgi:ubiquinone/menaquinone biosynthesis C-methylase UbiE